MGWLNSTGRNWKEYPELSGMMVGENFDANNYFKPSEMVIQNNSNNVKVVDMNGVMEKIDGTNRELRYMKKAFMERPVEIVQTIEDKTRKDVNVKVEIKDDYNKW